MANNDRLLVLQGAGDLGIRLADKAEKEIAAALAKLAASRAPCMTHAIGMIDMALALDLIGAEQASSLKDQLRRVFNYRRTELNEQRIARILGGES